MKTIEINLFEYSELSKEAKEKALEDYRNSPYTGTAWQEDNLETLKKGLEYFGCAVNDWSIDYFNASRGYVTFRVPEELQDLKGKELKSHLICNHTQTDFEDCPLTGYCADYQFLDPIIKIVVGRQDTSLTYTQLMQQCVSRVLTYMQEDYEHQMTEEYFRERCEANDYYFLESGELYS